MLCYRDAECDVLLALFRSAVVCSVAEGSFVDKDPVLLAGEYTFDFECKLPQELPSSFEGRHGQVRYLARACIERNWKSNVVTKKAFTILNGLDLNFIPEAAVSMSAFVVCSKVHIGRFVVSLIVLYSIVLQPYDPAHTHIQLALLRRLTSIVNDYQ